LVFESKNSISAVGVKTHSTAYFSAAPQWFYQVDQEGFVGIAAKHAVDGCEMGCLAGKNPHGRDVELTARTGVCLVSPYLGCFLLLLNLYKETQELTQKARIDRESG